MARVVVITGGGTGIGAACARLMRAAGDRVFITGRREAPLQAVATRPAPRRWWAMPPTAGVAPAAATGDPRPDRRD